MESRILKALKRNHNNLCLDRIGIMKSHKSNNGGITQTASLSTQASIFSSHHHFTNQLFTTHFHKSHKVFIFDRIRCGAIQRRLLSAQTSLSLSRTQLTNEKLTTHFHKSYKATIFDRIPLKFLQRRSLSNSNDIPVVSTVSSLFDDSQPQPIDAGSPNRKPISLWPGMYHSPATNALWEARSSIFEKPNNSDGGSGTDSIVSKTPSKSRTSILYKFSTDYILREQYRNPWNEIRMGKLFEDLDALAGTISYKHCANEDGSTKPVMLVTASVDRMVLKRPIPVDSDLQIVGAVTWVGRSSMEIQLQVIQSRKGSLDVSDSVALVANFTFVARDSRTGKSALINQIIPETDEEKMLWEEAEKRNKILKKKREESKQSRLTVEVERMDGLLAEGRVFLDMPALADRDSILIKDTCHENSFICQPQQRNIHGRIFGGFLMRKAFELAFSNAYAFIGAAPCFLEVDHVDFLKPVDVGNYLRLKSCILYTQLENPSEPLINVEVIAHVTQPEKRSSEVSNKFYFTFTVRPEAMKDGLKVRNTVPATEEEAYRILERMDAESCNSLES